MAVAGLDELLRSRELTANLVRRDLKVRHRGTFLGMLWSLATPLLLVGLYYVVFTVLFKLKTTTDSVRPDGTVVPFAVYFFGGLVIWNLFSVSVTASTDSVIGAGYLLSKVAFPRAVLPLSTVLSSLVTFAFELAVLVAAALVFVGPPNFQILWLPVIVLIATVLAFGLALLLSAVTVFFRDVAHFIGVFMQLWFWGTPIIYSMSFVAGSPGLVRILKLNPMTGLVISFRDVVLLNRPPQYGLLAYGSVVALVALVVGATLFQRWQKLFSEIL